MCTMDYVTHVRLTCGWERVKDLWMAISEGTKVTTILMTIMHMWLWIHVHDDMF